MRDSEESEALNPKNFRNINFYVISSCAIETKIYMILFAV